MPQGHAAVLTFHPGAGRLVSIEGEEEVRSVLTEIMDFRIRKKTGDVIDEHTNTSNEVGHILFWEKSREEITKAVQFVEEKIKFEIEK